MTVNAVKHNDKANVPEEIILHSVSLVCISAELHEEIKLNLLLHTCMQTNNFVTRFFLYVFRVFNSFLKQPT